MRLAARLLRNRGLLQGLGHALAASDPEVRTLATAVLRRWALTLKAMVWAEHALGQSWDAVRPADIVCLAFSATKPEWPRRLLAISHRSFEVKPQLRKMGVWKSARCAIDATYVPSWETNTGMIWGLFAATPALVRVRTRLRGVRLVSPRSRDDRTSAHAPTILLAAMWWMSSSTNSPSSMHGKPPRGAHATGSRPPSLSSRRSG